MSIPRIALSINASPNGMKFRTNFLIKLLNLWKSLKHSNYKKDKFLN